jgi:hypothetical protein
MLQFWIALGDVETPSWAVALGTPVLVFAALGFVVRVVWRRAWSGWRGEKTEEEKKKVDWETGNGASAIRSMSQAYVFLTLWHRITSLLTSNRPTLAPTVNHMPSGEDTPVIEGPGLRRQKSNFWSRDLHYLLSHVFDETEPPSPISRD